MKSPWNFACFGRPGTESHPLDEILAAFVSDYQQKDLLVEDNLGLTAARCLSHQ